MVHSIATDIVMTNVLAAGWKGNHCLCPVGVLCWRYGGGIVRPGLVPAVLTGL